MVSSKDIARRAGVSQTTVSRVLNNSVLVNPETREKVLQAIRELNYYPNLVARSLVTQSSRTIALISGTLKNNFFVETTDAIVNFATERGYQTMVYFQEDGLEEVFRIVLGSQVRGLLLSSIKLDDPLHNAIVRSNIPYFYFNRRPRQGGNYVVLDNEMASRLVTRHLLWLGHRHIAYLTGGLESSTFLERKNGFARTMEENGVPIIPDFIRVLDPRQEADITSAAESLMRLPAPPTAILCATDMIAMQLMDALMKLGVKIPEDISVAGMDLTRIATHKAIQLTTAGHPILSIGELAAERLLDWIENGNSSQDQHIVLKPRLYAGRTTASL